jgi:two-component system, LytTR family, sensor kinase
VTATRTDTPFPSGIGPAGRWILAGIVAGVAAFLSLLETSRNYFGNQVSGYPMPWLDIFATSAPSWTIMAALTPLPLAMTRRVPIRRAGLGRALAIHLAAAFLFAAIHTLGMSLYIAITRSAIGMLSVLLLKFSGTVAVSVMVYAAIVGAAHAVRFYRDVQARELAESRLQASLSEARLAALRGQLNPHFLFNTLNAMSTMALSGDQDRVIQTIGSLSDLLRVSLDDHTPQEIPLADELKFLDRYMDVQRIRLGDRLRVDYEIEPAALQAVVPSLLLQPLVENAITHGLARIPGPGTVAIRAHRDSGTLCIEVSDTGPGFRDGAADGIGLTNTRARLLHLYGPGSTLTASNVKGAGATVSVVMPFRTQEDRPVRATA